MKKSILTAALLGWVVLLAWQFVVNGIFGVEASINMNRIAEEQSVYSVLKEHVVAPGRYVVNPEPLPGQGFPANEPVFSVFYGGVGHEFAGPYMLVALVISFLAPLIMAWMLSQASERVIASYAKKVLSFSAFGVLFALLADISSIGIGGYPARDAMLLAVSHVLMWTVVGLVVAWRIRPE